MTRKLAILETQTIRALLCVLSFDNALGCVSLKKDASLQHCGIHFKLHSREDQKPLGRELQLQLDLELLRMYTSGKPVDSAFLTESGADT